MRLTEALRQRNSITTGPLAAKMTGSRLAALEVAGPGQIGDDEADRWIEQTRVPLDLGHHSARFLPALRLIGEARVIAGHLKRRSTDGTRAEVSDLALHDGVGRQPPTRSKSLPHPENAG